MEIRRQWHDPPRRKLRWVDWVKTAKPGIYRVERVFKPSKYRSYKLIIYPDNRTEVRIWIKESEFREIISGIRLKDYVMYYELNPDRSDGFLFRKEKGLAYRSYDWGYKLAYREPSTFEQIRDRIAKFFTGLFDGFKGFVGGVFDRIKGFFGGIFGRAKKVPLEAEEFGVEDVDLYEWRIESVFGSGSFLVPMSKEEFELVKRVLKEDEKSISEGKGYTGVLRTDSSGKWSGSLSPENARLLMDILKKQYESYYGERVYKDYPFVRGVEAYLFSNDVSGYFHVSVKPYEQGKKTEEDKRQKEGKGRGKGKGKKRRR